MAGKKEESVKIDDGRILPNNFEAEQSVLGSALIDNEATLLVVSRLIEEDFYNDTHKQVFRAIKSLFADSRPVDFVTVSDELEKNNMLDSVGGIAYISSLANIVPSAASCSHYVDIVRRDSVLRQVIKASGSVIEKAYGKGADENIIGVAEKAIYEIAERGKTGDLERIDSPLERVIGRFEDIHKDNTILRGLKTGFYQFDKVTNGLQKSDFIIIAARPGVGKTSLAMNIVSNAAIDAKAKCAVFSLEMGREQLVQRMLCSVANVSMAKALRGELNESEWARIFAAQKKLNNADIFIDDNAMNTPSQVLHKCRKLKRERGLDLIVIDYIGLMKSDERTDNRQNEVASISRQLKILAKEINVPVISLCQLNRSVEQRQDGKPGRPVLSDLRESGSIEQDADMVCFIHRDMSKHEIEENKNGNYTAELIIAKFRNGETGSIFLGWDGARTSFVNLEKDANAQSIVEQYQNFEDAKHAKKVSNRTAEDFKNTINGIINNMDSDEILGNIPQPEFAPIGDDLVPPPEDKNSDAGFTTVPDFSDVQIPSDDELF